MPLSGTLTKARIVKPKGCANKETFGTVNLVLYLISLFLESIEDALIVAFQMYCVKKTVRRGCNPITGKDAVRPSGGVTTFKSA